MEVIKCMDLGYKVGLAVKKLRAGVGIDCGLESTADKKKKYINKKEKLH